VHAAPRANVARVKVTIRYCKSCGYRGRADQVAAALQQALAVTSELVVGKPGEFTIWLGDRLIVEKDHRGWPDPDDVVDAIRDASA